MRRSVYPLGVQIYLSAWPDIWKKWNRIIGKLIFICTGFDANAKNAIVAKIIKSGTVNTAIFGAGRLETTLLREINANQNSNLKPVCFIDSNPEVVGRIIDDIKVLHESEIDPEIVAQYELKTVVFTDSLSIERQKELVKHFNKLGLKLMVYDYPRMESAEKKRQIRSFDIDELLFRSVKSTLTVEITNYYADKVIMITGGGGSIGSELCRQIAKMSPKCLVIVDVYENGAYEIQQELERAYRFDIEVEIITVCNKAEVDAVFAKYRPDIVLHAAAHKHVPLMENNVCEAVANNVFGTLNVVEAAMRYEVSKFIMISTDKAVNPTNVMGATKRMCEMMVLAHNGRSRTVFTCTRFGNVLGSNGSVIPLFKRQIEQGGPVTITDKRIIRYFMTIPEASQLVLTAGAMAQRGELFVLDMGKPVHILELAENLIRLSGFTPYIDINIVETGLRPGEKLYEELLIKTEELDKTGNDLIFVERETLLTAEELEDKLALLKEALDANDNEAERAALRKVVPTYHTPEEVNRKAIEAEEMLAANT